MTYTTTATDCAGASFQVITDAAGQRVGMAIRRPDGSPWMGFLSKPVTDIPAASLAYVDWCAAQPPAKGRV